jgi:hypothetical protein
MVRQDAEAMILKAFNAVRLKNDNAWQNLYNQGTVVLYRNPQLSLHIACRVLQPPVGQKRFTKKFA